MAARLYKYSLTCALSSACDNEASGALFARHRARLQVVTIQAVRWTFCDVIKQRTSLSVIKKTIRYIVIV